ncbi:UbiX family flavin prenyltransferase [Desulfolithobacter sp.]
MRIILAITGATGMLYVVEFARLLLGQGVEVHGVVSEAGRKVFKLEQGLEPEELAGVSRWFSINDFTAPMASGSSPYQAMVVLPCTAGTLGAIAGGYSGNLIHRAADVTLKERRPLLLCFRETPLNRTHIRNMLALHDAGATICPLMPSFYQKPENFREMAHHFSGRLCDQLGLTVPGLSRWEGVV